MRQKLVVGGCYFGHFENERFNDDIFEEEEKTSVHMEEIRQLQAKTIDFTNIYQNV